MRSESPMEFTRLDEEQLRGRYDIHSKADYSYLLLGALCRYTQTENNCARVLQTDHVALMALIRSLVSDNLKAILVEYQAAIRWQTSKNMRHFTRVMAETDVHDTLTDDQVDRLAATPWKMRHVTPSHCAQRAIYSNVSLLQIQRVIQVGDYRRFKYAISISDAVMRARLVKLAVGVLWLCKN